MHPLLQRYSATVPCDASVSSFGDGLGRSALSSMTLLWLDRISELSLLSKINVAPIRSRRFFTQRSLCLRCRFALPSLPEAEFWRV